MNTKNKNSSNNSIFRGGTIFQEGKFLFFSYESFKTEEKQIVFNNCVITHSFMIDGKGVNLDEGYEFETIKFNITDGSFELYMKNDKSGYNVGVYFKDIEIIEYIHFMVDEVEDTAAE